MKVPICLIIDDPAPVVSVWYAHSRTGLTPDGRPIPPRYPNSYLMDFCDVIEKRGIKGKFSLVPMPGNYGDIVNGIEGVSDEELNEWLDTVKERVAPRFSIAPELLTHNKAVDLETNEALPMRENEWVATQDRTTLTPYISKALSLLKEAGFDCCGVNSPWTTGWEVIDEYAAAISQAIYDVYGKKNAWYYLHNKRNTPNVKPWIDYEEDGRTLVSIPATTFDETWKTLENARDDDEFINELADNLITKDGKSGDLIKVIETGGYPVILTHWQAMYSNGAYTGLKIIDEVAKRVNEHLLDKVEWMTAEEIMEMVLKNKDEYRVSFRMEYKKA